VIEKLKALWSTEVASVISAVVVALLILLVYLIVRRSLVSSARKGRLSPVVVTMLRAALRWAALLLLVLVVLQELGMLQNAWAALTAVAAMVAIGFVAVWSVLSNALCTVLLLIFKPFRIGDRVELPADEVGGIVVDLNFAYTTLLEDGGQRLQIPNNLFFQKIVRRKARGGEIELEEQLARRDEQATATTAAAGAQTLQPTQATSGRCVSE